MNSMMSNQKATWAEASPDFNGRCILEVVPEWRSGRGRYYLADCADYTDRLERAGVYDAEDARKISGDGEKCRVVVASFAFDAEREWTNAQLKRLRRTSHMLELRRVGYTLEQASLALGEPLPDDAPKEIAREETARAYALGQGVRQETWALRVLDAAGEVLQAQEYGLGAGHTIDLRRVDESTELERARLEAAHKLVGRVCRVIFDFDVYGKVAPAPKATLAELVDALRIVNAAPHERKQDPDDPTKSTTTIRVRPDPRLIAAVVACRDFSSAEPGFPGPPICVVPDEEHPGHAKALFVIRCKFDPDRVGEEEEEEE